METIKIVALAILGVLLLVGIVRVIFAPYKGFVDFLLELMLIDYLIDGLGYVFELIDDFV